MARHLSAPPRLTTPSSDDPAAERPDVEAGRELESETDESEVHRDQRSEGELLDGLLCGRIGHGRQPCDLTDGESRGFGRKQGAGSRAGRRVAATPSDPRVAAAPLFSRRAGLVAAQLEPLSSRHAGCAGGAAMNPDLRALAAMLHTVSQEAGS